MSGSTDTIEITSPNFSPLKDGLVIAICLLGAFFSFYFFWQDLNGAFSRHAEQVATISFKLRSAQRRFADRVLWSRLRQNSAVYNGDIIRTAELSEATITFAEGQEINLTENTLVRVLIENDQILMELTGGSINVTAPLGAPGISIIHGNDRADIAGGTTAAFSTEENDLHIWVSEGSVSVNSGAVVPAGTALSVSSGLVRSSDPSVVLSLPPAAEFYASPEALVEFSWSANNYTNEKTRLEIATDRRFTQPFKALDSEDNAAVVALPPGNFWWRAYPVGTDGTPSPPAPGSAMSGKLTIKPGEVPEPVLAALPTPVSAPAPVAAPVSRTPANFVVDADYLRKSRSINFSWESVPGASGYIFTLYKENPSGRQEILQNSLGGTSYTLEDVRRIGEGSFIWQVVAVNSNNQRGNILENRFTVSVPQPKDPKILETGELYGEE